MKKSDRRKRIIVRIIALVLAVGMVLLSLTYLFAFSGTADNGLAYVAYASDSAEKKAKDRLDILDDVIDYIYEAYKDKVSYETLVNAAYQGLFDSLDSYTEYYFASEGADALPNALESNYAGIGVTIQLNEDNNVLIIAVTKDGPAEKSGVKAGGIITKINGVSTKGMSIDDAATKMRGAAGTEVKVTVSYSGIEKTFTLIREKLVAPSLNYEMMGEIGYIQLESFSTASAKEFADARMSLLAEGAKGLVLDLRNNTGGYLDVAIEISDMLLDSGNICFLEQQGKIIETYTAAPDDTKKVPIVLLINDYTASASEILVMALTENGAAKTVGTNTYGKGVAQVIIPVVNGDSFKISQCYFLGPKKTRITENGITPDFTVYSAYNFDEKTKELINNILPLDLKKKFSSGQYGLNVLAAQQRLSVLGFDVDFNARMDSKTMEALKEVQRDAGGIPYGALDFFTLKALNARYEAAVSGSSEDLQLKVALDQFK